MFPHFRNELQLTTPGESRTHWTLPQWFFPEGATPLSYHGDLARWVRQEFGETLPVILATGYSDKAQSGQIWDGPAGCP